MVVEQGEGDIDVSFAIIGILAGLMGGLLGIGGGSIIVPALVFFHKMETSPAMTASLIAIMGVAVASTTMSYVHYQERLPMKSMLLLAVLAAVGSLVGRHFRSQLSSDTLNKLFGVLLLVVSIRMIAGAQITALWKRVAGG